MDPDWWRLYHRLAVAYRPHRPESTFKGTVLCLLRHHFSQEQQWLIVPEALLREIAEEQLPPNIGSNAPGPELVLGQEANEPDENEGGMGDSGEEYGLDEDSVESDYDEEMAEDGVSDDEEMESGTADGNYTDSLDSEDGDGDGDGDGEGTNGPHPNVSMDSQGLITREARRKANRPDFIVSKFGGALFTNQAHLYVEVKNGSTHHTTHTVQLRRYIYKISKAIPPGFLNVHQDVILMLVDASTTYYWRITPERFHNNRNIPIWDWAQKGDTLGDRIDEVLVELSQRPNVPLT